MENEESLIKRLRNGDYKAMRPILEKYQDYVYTLVVQIVKDKPEAQDLTQEVFIKVYKKIDTFKGNSKFSTWLYTVTYRTCLNFLEKKKIIYNMTELDASNKTEVDEKFFQDEIEIPQDPDIKRVLWGAIDSIPYNQGLVITLFYLQQFSVKEIAGLLELSENTVKTNLFRGRNSIKQVLLKRYSEEELL